MDNKWREIWNRRKPVTGGLTGDWEHIYLELKRLNGYDIMEGGISLDAWLELDAEIQQRLHLTHGGRVFEVGCGAGANLYLLQRAGITVGGTDYAEGLVAIARTVLPHAAELYAGEADAIDTAQKYDAVFTNGVLHYLPDLGYAEHVLLRMLEKTTGAIGLIDVHDRDREEDFHAYRRSVIPDYDGRYKGLSNLFFPRSFFEDFARAHDLRIVFTPMQLRGYWNAPFSFNVFLYRR